MSKKNSTRKNNILSTIALVVAIVGTGLIVYSPNPIFTAAMLIITLTLLIFIGVNIDDVRDNK